MQDPFEAVVPKIQATMMKALLMVKPASPDKFRDVFVSRLSTVCQNSDFIVDVPKMSANSVVWVAEAATRFTQSVVVPLYRFGCDGWQLSSSDSGREHCRRFGWLFSSLGQHHFLVRHTFLDSPGVLLLRLGSEPRSQSPEHRSQSPAVV